LLESNAPSSFEKCDPFWTLEYDLIILLLRLEVFGDQNYFGAFDLLGGMEESLMLSSGCAPLQFCVFSLYFRYLFVICMCGFCFVVGVRFISHFCFNSFCFIPDVYTV